MVLLSALIGLIVEAGILTSFMVGCVPRASATAFMVSNLSFGFDTTGKTSGAYAFHCIQYCPKSGPMQGTTTIE